MFLTSWVSVLYSLLDSKLSDSLYKTNPHIDDAPAIDEKIAKITMQGVGIFRGNQKRCIVYTEEKKNQSLFCFWN